MIKMLLIWLQVCILGDVGVMIVCELKSFSHISNHHNMYTHMQSCDVFHTQHAIFFAIFDTYADTMWFGHHKFYIC